MLKIFSFLKPKHKSKDLSYLPIDFDLKALYNTLSYTFKNKEIVIEALSHRSFSAKYDIPSNQRLEYLGDAVIELVTAHALYKNNSDKEEGPLTEARSSLVKCTNLAKVTRKLGLGKYLLLTSEEHLRDGRENPSILADLYEAIAGAIYLDGGIRSAENFIHATLLSDIDSAFHDAKLTNYKSRLLEYVQANSLPNVKYVVVDQEGPDHAKIFKVEATINGESLGSGSGKKLKEAEQSAAKMALSQLEDKNKNSVSETEAD